MTAQIDSVVLVIIDRLNKQGDPFGIRALVKHCQLADKTISKGITRLEKSKRLRVVRGDPGSRHEYMVLTPPTPTEIMATALHLGEPISLER